MKITEKTLKLPEGDFETEVLIFDITDRAFLFELYNNWRILCQQLQKIEARAVNLPEGLSEGAFCLAMNTVRVIRAINGANTSFDCFDMKTNKRIQVKACSVIPDLTSFGPKSVWDQIYFVDFFRNGEWDGTFDVYLIKNEDIYDHKVNSHQTLRDQQLEGRRPRFSIYKEIIQEKNITPVKTFDLSKSLIGENNIRT